MKKIICTILSLVFLFSSFTVFARVDAPHRNNIDVVAEGECGKQLVWILYDDGELDIEITGRMEVLLSNTRLVKAFDEDAFISDGTCDMYNYNPEEAPWYQYRENIETVVVNEDVTYLGNYAFYNCANIKTIEIKSDLLSEIGYDCFAHCQSLESINIPERVCIIGSSAFEGCSSLKNITLPNNLKYIYHHLFCMCKNLTELKINSGVREIQIEAFTNCYALSEIHIPATVEKIGYRAFYNCDSLEKIYYYGNKEQWNAISVASGNSGIDNAKIVFSTEDDITYNEMCTVCGKEISSEEAYYDGDDALCEECYNEAMDTIEPLDEKHECSVCGESFNIVDLLFYDDGNIICQDCHNELSAEVESYIECIHCGEVSKENEDILDEYGNVVCQHCGEIIVYFKTYFDYDEEDDDYYEDEEYEEDDYDEDEEYDEDYEDIDFITSDWAYDEVCESYRKDLIPGEMLYDELDEDITREEFCTIAVKLYESLSGKTVDADTDWLPFTDCDYSDYISYIAIAYDLGITNGTSKTTFSPYDNISREQLATMLYRVINCVDSDYTEYFDLRDVRKFNDDTKISVYAKEGVYFLAEIGAVKGVLNGNFAPAETATKEQAILISLRCTEIDSSLKY